MAFVNPNEVVPGQPAPAAGQAPVAAGGAGVGGSAKAAATPGQNLPAQPSAQLSAYLGANQPQAKDMAGNVATSLAGQVGAAGQAINPAVNAYTGNLYSVPTDTSVNSAVAASPSSLTPEQQATYKTELGAAGKAPNAAATFETTAPYQGLTSDIQKAVDQSNLWNAGNNVSSLSTAISPFEGPNATKGDKTLDALLLSQVPDAYSKIQGAAAPAAGLQDQLAAGTTTANTALQNAIAQDTATTPAAQASAQQYANNLKNQLAQYLAQAQDANNTYNSDLNLVSDQEASLQPQIAALENAINSFNSFTKSDMNPGIFSPQGPLFKQIQYGDLGTLPQVSGLPPVGTMATPQQYSDVAALQSYLDPTTFAALNAGLDPSQASLAGTYRPPTSDVPLVQSIVDPLLNATAPGFVANDTMLGEQQGNSAVANVVGNYTAVQNAYKALVDAMNKLKPIGPPPPPPPTGGGGGIRPI